MLTHRETPPPMGSIIGNGGRNSQKAWTLQTIDQPAEISISEYAADKVASKFRLTISTARLVCHLAGIGGPQ